MNCRETQAALDDLLDLQLDVVAQSAVTDHIGACADCRQAYERERVLRAALRDMPAPLPEPGFAERVVAETARRGRGERRHRLWLPLGSAVAAGFALWLAVGLTGTGLAPVADLPEVSIALNEPQTVNLAVNAEQAMDKVRFTVRLPVGVEMMGVPGTGVVTWEGTLRPGGNLLSLPLVARQGNGGELEARVEHGQKSKVYRFHMEVRPVANVNQA